MEQKKKRLPSPGGCRNGQGASAGTVEEVNSKSLTVKELQNGIRAIFENLT